MLRMWKRVFVKSNESYLGPCCLLVDLNFSLRIRMQERQVIQVGQVLTKDFIRLR